MKDIFKDAAAGLSFAGIGSILVQFQGFTQTTLIVLLYMMVVLAVIQGLKHRESFPAPSFLERIVLVAEGEELKMKKLLTGEKYKVKGDLEKL